eukprot:6475705-Amphidinium_carterae.1
MGQYTGGLLWVEATESDLTDSCVPLPEEIRGPAPAGLMGHLLDPRCNWVRFDGRSWHGVLPAVGKRLSVTLFSPRGYHKLTGEHWRTLVGLGFFVEPLLGARLASSSSPVAACDVPILRELLEKVSTKNPVRDSTSEENNCVDKLLCCLHPGPPCDFSDFLDELRRLCRGELTRRSFSSSGFAASMFPCGVPYMTEFVGRSSPPSSRRRAGRWHSERRVRMLVNYVMIYVQWLHLAQPSGGILAERIAFQTNPESLAAIAHVTNSIRAWCRSAGNQLPVDGGLSQTCSALMERVARDGHLGSYSGFADSNLASS